MAWWQFSLNCQSGELEQIEDLLLEAGALSLSLSDAGDEPIYEPLPGNTPVWSESVVTATFASEIDAESIFQQLSLALPAHLVPGLRQHQLQDQDWDQVYKEHLKPIQCAETLWIVPSWLEPPDHSATNIRLDPGVAFGTGGHATTALCLGWLAENPPHGLEVIDYGCGSGILAIAACKLGATQVIATDIDPQALTASRSNQKMNHIPNDQMATLMPNEMPERKTDLLIANILAGPLIDLSSRFATMVKPGGQILLSGILKTQLKEIQSAYMPFFELDSARPREDWISISGERIT
ncbi:MAG: 50S ribosomal protein L11 methyltransferase [Pseudomonadota bacterium]